MNKRIITTLIALLIPMVYFAQNGLPEIKGYKVEKSVDGDLDKDGTSEKAVVYIQKNGDPLDLQRQLVIYKKSGGTWKKWYESRTAIFGTGEGGAQGDPFQDIEIKNGILIIEQAGGSNWYWTKIDKYRFQNNDFYLIGYTTSYGHMDQETVDVDFNLSTGDIIYKKYVANRNGELKLSETEKFNKKGIKVTLSNRDKEVSFTSPKYKADIFL